METVRDFNFLGSKITADGECSHEIKTLAPWKKNYDQPRQNIKKQKYYFANKVHMVKAMVFPVVIYECECLGIVSLTRFSLANRDSLGIWGVIFVE